MFERSLAMRSIVLLMFAIACDRQRAGEAVRADDPATRTIDASVESSTPVTDAARTPTDAGETDLRAWFTLDEEMCRPDDGPGGTCEYLTLKLRGVRSEDRPIDKVRLPRPRVFNDSADT